MVPSMMRLELLHPIAVHFPIALLIVGSAIRLFALSSFSGNSERQRFLMQSAQLMTVLGGISAWAAWYSGELAEDEVNANLCDPTITHLHGEYALYVSILFSVIALIDLSEFLLPKFQGFKPNLYQWVTSRAARVTCALGALVGCGLLVYVGHLGGSLTYNQAAGVYVPSPQCTEFSDEANSNGVNSNE